MIRSRDSKKKSFYTTDLLTSKAKSTAWVWTLWASSRETCSKLFSVKVPFSMVTSAKDFIHCIHGYSSSQLWPAGKIYETSYETLLPNNNRKGKKVHKVKCPYHLGGKKTFLWSMLIQWSIVSKLLVCIMQLGIMDDCFLHNNTYSSDVYRGN